MTRDERYRRDWSLDWPNQLYLDSIEPIDIVGYVHYKLVDKLSALGFEPIGNLTVWIKTIIPRTNLSIFPDISRNISLNQVIGYNISNLMGDNYLYNQ